MAEKACSQEWWLAAWVEGSCLWSSARTPPDLLCAWRPGSPGVLVGGWAIPRLFQGHQGLSGTLQLACLGEVSGPSPACSHLDTLWEGQPREVWVPSFSRKEGGVSLVTRRLQEHS